MNDNLQKLQEKIQLIPTEDHKPQHKNSKPVNKELVRREDLEAKEKNQTIQLREKYANLLLWLLIMEIVFIGVIVALGGVKISTKWFSYETNPYLVSIFSSGALIHSFMLVKIIVENLFVKTR